MAVSGSITHNRCAHSTDLVMSGVQVALLIIDVQAHSSNKQDQVHIAQDHRSSHMNNEQDEVGPAHKQHWQ